MIAMPRGPKPWHDYRVGPVSTTKSFTEPSCRPFEEVSHVSHIEPALRIIADRKIRQGLVFDESKLNTERILVTWLSPNSWSDGFRYGNVRFTADFEKLVRGKRFYWVEAITSYNPTACRILITTADRSATLTAYDPTERDGPWWYDQATETHYMNGHYTLEFMAESDLLMSQVERVDFVHHHRGMCSIHRTSPKSCSEVGLQQDKAGARFLAMAVSRSINLERLNASLIEEDGELTYRVRECLGSMMIKLQNVTYLNKVTASSDTGKAVARATLNALATDQAEEAKLLASLFRNEHLLIKALATVVSESIGWNDLSELEKALTLS